MHMGLMLLVLPYSFYDLALQPGPCGYGIIEFTNLATIFYLQFQPEPTLQTK